MNTRMRYLRKFYMLLGEAPLQYTWYINEGGTISTEFYFGLKAKTGVPKNIKGTDVTILGCTTYCNSDIISEVIIPNTITEIE